MLVLALETVTRAGSVALMDGDVCEATTGDATRTHGERLPHDVTDWLARHGRSIADVDLFAVIAGPGSFTGLRVGIAAIQGFALSRSRAVVPVPTLDALAHGWLGHAPLAGPGLLVACLDGQRGEVFSAAWEVAPGQSLEDARVVFDPRVTPPEPLVADLRQRSDKGITIVGDGARRYASIFNAANLPLEIADAPVPLAGVAARLAMAHPDRAVAPHALRPIYIRRPDAVLARDRAQARARAGEDPIAGFTIDRAVTREELAAVESLQRQTFTNPWAAESIKWELENTDVARLYVMRATDQRVVAYCACWIVFDELHINSLAVDPAWRRRGLARRLLVSVFGDAVASGAQSATLEVRRSNEAARALYEGLGFKVDGVRRDYYQHPREDALILWNRQLPAEATV
ncbi:MAG TPA: tRNA (adenosine(37)-N6)-threonylcarbamoyltransferase complex dimerization subunit type 1 TsaB [Vicinamibacterales bacterium]|nr:tRNA (adenosine(37)-N6)-threonylcarbamoyltransferase complex dimerization subunit type 1 TsaB [Vicinamibacterales bacterium]